MSRSRTWLLQVGCGEATGCFWDRGERCPPRGTGKAGCPHRDGRRLSCRLAGKTGGTLYFSFLLLPSLNFIS